MEVEFRRLLFEYHYCSLGLVGKGGEGRGVGVLGLGDRGWGGTSYTFVKREWQLKYES